DLMPSASQRKAFVSGSTDMSQICLAGNGSGMVDELSENIPFYGTNARGMTVEKQAHLGNISRLQFVDDIGVPREPREMEAKTIKEILDRFKRTAGGSKRSNGLCHNSNGNKFGDYVLQIEEGVEVSGM
ncbi:hypothetical protein KI387_029253, partial [Taxus chinensis]